MKRSGPSVAPGIREALLVGPIEIPRRQSRPFFLLTRQARVAVVTVTPLAARDADDGILALLLSVCEMVHPAGARGEAFFLA